MTKADLVKKLRLEEKGAVDYALPQQWVNYVVDEYRFDYHKVISQFVMFYPFSGFGIDRIYPLTAEAAKMLWIVEHSKLFDY